MTLKGLVAAGVTFLLGFVLGCIPGLNDHLRINLWYAIPIGGFLFGFLAGGVQFWWCYRVNEEVSKYLLFCLMLASLVGYASMDYGIYRTTTMSVEGEEGMEDGTYRMSELISFADYMKWKLSSSTWKKNHFDEFTLGATATTLLYFGDLVGAALGTCAMTVILRAKYPYCRPCRMYKRRERQYVIQFAYEEELAKRVLEGIGERIAGGDYAAVLSHVRELAEAHANRKGDMKVSVDHRLCAGCGGATLLGKVQLKKKDIDKLAFVFTKEGEAGSRC